MKTTIDVTSRKEAFDLRAGLMDPTVRAFVVIMGALSQLPSDRARQRVLTFVQDKFADEAEAQK